MLALRCWLVVTVVVVAGCSASGEMPTAPVKGKVTYKGQPVTAGTVMFVPAQGPAATGEIQKDGTFSLTTYNPDDGAVIGSHKVSITALQDIGDALPEQRNPLPPPLVPEKYLSHDSSGLTADVKADGPNEFDFALTD